MQLSDRSIRESAHTPVAESEPDGRAPGGFGLHRLRALTHRRQRKSRSAVFAVGWLAVAATPGLIVFLLLFRSILDPRHMGWLFANNPITFDIATSGMGWLYFSNDSWRWPIGSNPHYGGHVADSLLFSDSMPSFSVPLKLLFKLVGSGGETQVLGLSLLTCLLLQSAFGHALIRTLGGSRLLAVLGSVFFVTSPVLLFRWNIASLFWQWLVLAGMLIVVSQLPPWKRTLSWSLLVIVASGITPYIALMTLCTAGFDQLVRGVVHRAWLWTVAGLALVGGSAYVGLVTWGTFSIPSGEAPLTDLGLYSANLLALVDGSGLSYFVGDVRGGTGEGTLFVGGGVLVLLFCATGALLTSPWTRPTLASVKDSVERRPAVAVLAVSSAFLAMLAALPVLRLGGAGRTLPLPDKFLHILAIFRANGRFGWPLMYLVMLVAVLFAARIFRGRGTAVVAVALLLQLVDTQNVFRAVHTQVTASARQMPEHQMELDPIMQSPGITAFEVVPAFPYPPDLPYRELGLAAERAGLPTTSMGYFNRYDTAAIGRIQAAGLAAVQGRHLRRDTIYVVKKDLYDANLRAWPGARALLALDGWEVVRAAD